MSDQTLSRRSFLEKTALVGAVAMAAGAGLAGCANEQAAESEPAEPEAAESASDGASASAAESGAAKPVILVVSFGTSFNDSRHITIGAVESAIREKFPDYDVRRAFTSQIIIDKLKERDGVVIDNVEEALNRIVADGVTQLAVQPTHLMNGYEYTDLADALETYQDKIETITLGDPLLTTDEDYQAVVDALVAASADADDGETALCFMGHGTEAESNMVYTTLQQKFVDLGYKQYFVGTVEAEPTCEDVVKGVTDGGFKKAVLRPLMVVAGDHANNDMADLEDPESWASQFKAAGIEPTCVIEGLGQMVAIDDIYVAHTQAAVDALQA